MSHHEKLAPSTHLETVIIFTSQMEQLAKFYKEAFDLGEYSPAPGHLGQQVGPIYFGFDQVEEMSVESQSVTLWFTVDDIQTTYERLLALGAQERYPPTEKPWGAVLAAVYDLDGNMVGLSQRQS